MTGAWRFTIAAFAAGLLLSPGAALAQASPAPTTNTPATDSVGPAELQNFNLKGTVTRPADQAPPPAASPTPRGAETAPTTLSPRRSVDQARSHQPKPPAASTPAPTIAAAPPPGSRQPPATAPAPEALPTTATPPIQTVAPQAAPVAVEPAAPSDDHLPSLRGPPLWPWIAALLALAAGAGFLLWRRAPREMAVGGPQFDLLAPAEPEPRPEPKVLPRSPAPAPPTSPPRRAPAASGVVASRLRPALELGFHPLRCQIDDDQVAIEFELELFNAGAAPARAVLAEASLLNAGATQDHELAAFFSNPNGVGERLTIIPPMKRVSFKSQVVAPRAAVQEYELAGRKAFVPVVAFNALYEWSGGKAQSSAAYLVGRDTQQDKLGPLRIGPGAREFRELGARPLPSGVRT